MIKFFSRFVKDSHQERFYNISKDFLTLMIDCENVKDLTEDFNIKREEISILMKITDFRMKDIKHDRNDWLGDIEPDSNTYRLSRRPPSREILDKMMTFIPICKDFPYLVEIKKILDKVAIKLDITIFEGMTDKEEEEYFAENFGKDKDVKYEDGKIINNFFS